MSEKKANELLKEYMDAELSGQDDKAEQIEDNLKKGGWKITIGPTGTIVQKVEKEGGFSMENMFLPKESDVSPYKGSASSKSGSNAKPLLIALGITAGVIGLIILIAYLVKRNKRAVLEAV